MCARFRRACSAAARSRAAAVAARRRGGGWTREPSESRPRRPARATSSQGARHSCSSRPAHLRSFYACEFNYSSLPAPSNGRARSARATTRKCQARTRPSSSRIHPARARLRPHTAGDHAQRASRVAQHVGPANVLPAARCNPRSRPAQPARPSQVRRSVLQRARRGSAARGHPGRPRARGAVARVGGRTPSARGQRATPPTAASAAHRRGAPARAVQRGRGRRRRTASHNGATAPRAAGRRHTMRPGCISVAECPKRGEPAATEPGARAEGRSSKREARLAAAEHMSRRTTSWRGPIGSRDVTRT